VRRLPATFLLLSALLTPTLSSADGRGPRGGHADVYVGEDRGHGDRIEAVQDELGRVLAELRSELSALDGLVDAADSRGVQRELHRKVLRIEELTDLSQALSDKLAMIARRARERALERPQETVVIVEQAPPPEVIVVDPGPIACSPDDFRGVLAAVENEPFPDGKLAVVRDAASHRWFTVAQVIALMGQMSFSSNKVDVGAELYGRTVDRENWYQVFAALTFDSDKQELRRRTGG
jgi:hypothetical protein